MTLPITINDQYFVLHQSGAIFWVRENVLMISDVHLGKVAHFRKHGFAIPHEAIHENFERLDNVVRFSNPTPLCSLAICSIAKSTMNGICLRLGSPRLPRVWCW
jgi:hypothetical protein